MEWPVDDFPDQDIGQYFDEAVKFINDALEEKESNVVLVHCLQGKSRSASIICAYLINKLQLNFQEAIDEVRKVRYS